MKLILKTFSPTRVNFGWLDTRLTDEPNASNDNNISKFDTWYLHLHTIRFKKNRYSYFRWLSNALANCHADSVSNVILWNSRHRRPNSYHLSFSVNRAFFIWKLYRCSLPIRICRQTKIAGLAGLSSWSKNHHSLRRLPYGWPMV